MLFSDFHPVQDHVNDIDFDYKEYARQRFEQY
jgi:choline/ethanolamine kinase